MFVRLTQKLYVNVSCMMCLPPIVRIAMVGAGGGGAHNQKNHCRFHVLIGGRKIKLKFPEISDKKYIRNIKMTVL